MTEFIKTSRGRRINVDLLPPEERFITTREGHQINLGLLSLGELKQIKRARALTPQEFVRSEEKDFVFLVKDEKTGKRSEVCVEKKRFWRKCLTGLFGSSKASTRR